MFLKPDLTVSEVLPSYKDGSSNPKFPRDLRCKSGHEVPPGTRFFEVSGDTLPRHRWGIYCQHCLNVARKLADRQRASSPSNGKETPTRDEVKALIQSLKS